MVPFHSVRAVFVGFLVVAIVSTLVDVVLHAVGVYPPWGEPIGDGLSLLAVTYRVVITVVAGYLTARLAPSRPVRHAVVLGLLGIAAATAGAAATWNVEPALGPHWYPLALIATALPCTWIGGWSAGVRKKGRLQPGPVSLAHGSPAGRSGRHGTAAGAQ